ncbi:MAG: XrtA/PEP-CTERM system histidine kinase PrsK [Rhizomicrobium sp.]
MSMILTIAYGLGCAAFVILLGLMFANRKPEAAGWRLFIIYGITAAWAGFAAFKNASTPGVVHVLGSLKLWAWLQFLASLFRPKAREANVVSAELVPVLVGTIAALIVLNDLRFVGSAVAATDYDITQIFGRVVLSIAGLFLVENLGRNTIPTRRWQVTPFAIAAGFLFAYDFYVFAEAMVTRHVDVSLLAGSGFVLVFMAPALFVAAIRNEDWRIDVHVSRNFVFHTATLTAGGLFLLVAAGLASALGHLSGNLGTILKVIFFCGCVFILVSALSVGRVRSQVRRLVTENFFATRFDYRAEWMRFVGTMSATESLESLQTRAIRALANVVDSPAGTLWLETVPGTYEPATFLNMRVAQHAKEDGEGSFIAGFEGGKTIQKFDWRANEPAQPDWAQSDPIWLAVPLVQNARINGFVTLAPPRAQFTLNWESYDLLRVLGLQLASYLSEERSTSALAESKALIDHNKRFAFAIHDIKNLANQLGLMVANAKRLGDRHEFRADMLTSLETSVERMRTLLARLQAGTAQPSRETVVDPVPIMRSVAEDSSSGNIPVIVKSAQTGARIGIDAESLRSVLTQLVSNAVDASSPGDVVTVSFRETDTRAILEVEDHGVGMSPAFVRDRLFKALQSTKERGHGIGAFQAREIVRSMGGDLEVLSVEGAGTTVRVILPRLSDAKRQVEVVANI